MNLKTTTAIAHPNIALIKYWGNHNQELRIPSNGSISMNLGALFTRTSVTFDESLQTDQLILQGELDTGPALQRVSDFLDVVRNLSSLNTFACVESENNFPMGTGIASSASAFAALSLAASNAAGMNLEEKDLSRLARRGSGSACRSVPGGFVEWIKGNKDEDSFAHSFASPGYWNLVDCVAIVSQEHKATGSVEGHIIAKTSPLQATRIERVPTHLQRCREAILQQDFETFAEISEHDCHMMHAVMMTSNPSLIYWMPPTLAIMGAVREWRESGIPACYTIDAGPNVHVICEAAYQGKIVSLLKEINGVSEVMLSGIGAPAHIISQ